LLTGVFVTPGVAVAGAVEVTVAAAVAGAMGALAALRKTAEQALAQIKIKSKLRTLRTILTYF